MSRRLEASHKYRYVPDEEIPCRRITPSKIDKLKTMKAFIKGPIDLAWITKASYLPGKTLNVALALMYLSGLNRSKEDLKLNKTIYELFNVSRSTVYGTLNRMEKEGLIKVKKKQGKKNVITILEICKKGVNKKR